MRCSGEITKDDLPPRLTTTVARSNYYHSEIRNIIQSKNDIETLWPWKSVDDMKIVGFDGARPGLCDRGGLRTSPRIWTTGGKDKDTVTGGSCVEGVGMINPALDLVSTLPHDPVPGPRVDSSEPPFYNLADKQKAMY
jgi:hypothetical protein